MDGSSILSRKDVQETQGSQDRDYILEFINEDLQIIKNLCILKDNY
jgi:hypothetical protein